MEKLKGGKDIKRFNYIYFLKSIFCKYKLYHILLLYAVIIMEKLFSKPLRSTKVENIQFDKKDLLPQINLQVTVGYPSNKNGFNSLKFSIIDFYNMNIKSWIVAPPSTVKTNALFKRYIYRYKAQYLRLRAPFMGIGRPHCFQISKKGYFCAPNGFYTYITDTSTNRTSIFPQNFLETEPMHYSKQGSFSPDGSYWYFVRWPLMDWKRFIDGEKENVRCEVGRVRLSDLQEEIITSLDYQDEVHEIACSPDNRYLVFCTLKADQYVQYPDKSYYIAQDEYRKSHEAGGIKRQKLATVDINTKRYWFTDIPVPVSTHIIFDPVEPNTIYLSSHNLVFHQLTAFLEGQAALYKLCILEGRTIIEKSFTDSDLFRIFQHDVFKYQNKTYIGVMSYKNILYIINTIDMSLYTKVRVGPEVHLDFSKTGNVLCVERSDIFFTVNASDDGDFLLLGSAGSFNLYDMVKGETVPINDVLPEGYGMGLGHTRAYGR